MSQSFTSVDGLVLKATPYGDSSVHLLVLTPDRGKLVLRVRGARRKGSPLLALVEPLVYARFSLFEYRGRLTVNEAEAHSFFMPLRSNVRLLALGLYLAEVADRLADGDCHDGQLLQLLLAALHRLCKGEQEASHIKAVFEWRAAALAGYRPTLEQCAVCHQPPVDAVIAVEEGHICCAACAGQINSGVLPLRQGGYLALRHVMDSPLERVYSFSADDHNWREAAEVYLQTQLMHGFDSLEYYRQFAD